MNRQTNDEGEYLHGEVLVELREALAPMVDEIASSLSHEIDSGGIEQSITEFDTPIINAPFSFDFVQAPGDFFRFIADSDLLELRERLVETVAEVGSASCDNPACVCVPEEITALLEPLCDRYYDMGFDGSDIPVKALNPAFATTQAAHDKSLPAGPRRLIRLLTSPDFNLQRWREYEEFVTSLPEDEARTWHYKGDHRTFNVLGAHAFQKLPFTDHAQRANRFLVLNGNRTMIDPVLAVGEYGPEHTRAILQAVAIVQQRIWDIPEARLAEITEEHADVIEAFTARGKRGADAAAVRYIALEGVLSTGQYFNTMTMREVVDRPNSSDLLHEMAQTGLAGEFSRRARAGVIGPMALGGYYLDESLSVIDGTLVHSSAVHADIFRVPRQNSVTSATHRPRAAVLRDGYRSGPLEIGCPVGNRGGALDRLAMAQSRLTNLCRWVNDLHAGRGHIPAHAAQADYSPAAAHPATRKGYS